MNTAARSRRMAHLTFCVMPGLVPGIHVLMPLQGSQDVDGRDEPGHDGCTFYYSTFKPSFFTSPLHFFSSWSISAAYSAGVEVSGSPPSLWICFCTSGRSTSLRSSTP